MAGRTVPAALPFWASPGLVPPAFAAATLGGAWLAAPPLYGWGLFSLLDALTGRDQTNADPLTPERALFWHLPVTYLWFPVQAAMLFLLMAMAAGSDGLAAAEKVALLLGVGMVTGTIGINCAHELMHQPGRLERWLADLLPACVLYGNFRSEHLRVHHLHVGPPPRCGDGAPKRGVPPLPRTGPPAVPSLGLRGRAGDAGPPRSAVVAPLQPLLALRGPAGRGAGGDCGPGGWEGLGLFPWQAAVAVWQLEPVNCIEPCGLTRRHPGGGRHEPVRPRHAWNAAPTGRRTSG